jgi:hypothetical protein
LASRYRQNKLLFFSLVSISIAVVILSFSSNSIVLESHQAFARCPNGFHKSPNGNCEAVSSHQGLPRCPNGYHRSPNGSCEAVNVNNSKGNNNNLANNGNANGIGAERPSSNNSTISSSGKCDQTLWNHVYNPTRLQVVDPCKTISGIVDTIKVESDGDFHIRLRVDPQFVSIINSANVNGQFGDLVLEPICQNPVIQRDAIASCPNFHQSLNIPPVGSHVTVTGSYVHDLDHGGWSEIHPITSIKP